MVKFSRINVRTLAENGRLRAISHNYVGNSFRVMTCIPSCHARIVLHTHRFWSLANAFFGECLRCLNSQNCQFLIQLPHPLLPADIKLDAQMVLLQRFGIVCLRVQPCRGKKKKPGTFSFIIHILSYLHHYNLVIIQSTFHFLSNWTLVVYIESPPLSLSHVIPSHVNVPTSRHPISRNTISRHPFSRHCTSRHPF